MSWACTLDATSCARLFVGCRIEVVVVDVLGDVLAVAGALHGVVPSGFAFIGEQNVCAVLPSKETGHTLVQFPGVAFFVVVEPVGFGAVEVGCPDVDHLWELVLQLWHDPVEWECVCRQMDPA